MACNRLQVGSQLFDSVFDPQKHDVMIAFGWDGNKWNVSLRSAKNGPDVSVLAKKYKGGGHVHSSGFQCQELPFKLRKD